MFLKTAHRDGLILDMMISENIALQAYYKEPLSKNGTNKLYQLSLHMPEIDGKEFDVRAASEFVPAAALSGNQQKSDYRS